MSLRARMAAIVGDENSVGRYLLEKIGHTTTIAWILVTLLIAVFVPDPIRALLGRLMVSAALAANIGYDGLGKLYWFRTHPADAFDLRDFLFDFTVGAFPAAFASVLLSVMIGPVIVGLWFLLFCILDNNALGKPS